MAYDRFFIGPLQTGLQKNLKPFLIADDAFELLQNAYTFRGRVRKRFGQRLMGTGWTSAVTEPLFSRLRVQVGTIGAPTSPVPGAIFKIGQMFSAGDIIFTVYQLGTPGIMLNTGPSVIVGVTDGAGNAAGVVPGAGFVGQTFKIGTQSFTVTTAGLAALSTSGTGSGTFNTGTGAFTFTGATPLTNILWVSSAGTFNTTTGAFTLSGTGLAGGTPIWWYPGEPVMGLCNYQNGPINNQPSYGFDTQFAYLFANGFWQRSGTVLLHGDNLDFVETCNYRGITAGGRPSLFITNFQVTNPNGAGTATDDPIWYTQDGTTWTTAKFYFAPTGTPASGPFVVTSRLIISFKNRLLLLNTIENDGGGGLGTNAAYANRVRYSFNGSPFAANAWYEPNTTDGTLVGKGAGFIDATTEEQIISAEFIKDRLIVYFERSTWELAYTGNYVIPFVWQKINTELGSEAQFSTVPFDTVILTMGTTGVHACSGSNVERIDTKIPDQVFEIQNRNLGVQRVYGVRDYFTELVYWTFPSTESGTDVYPTQVLVYNYRNGSWAIFTDCITAFGYFEQQNDNTSITWASTSLKWEEANMVWSSGSLDANFRQVIAGNQQGYVFICDPDESRNARAMQITNMVQSGSNVIVTCVDHTLTPVNAFDPSVGDYVILENFQGCTLTSTMYPDNIFPVARLGASPTSQFIIEDVVLAGSYTGGGTVSRVSNINIKSKQWNPYMQEGRSVFLDRIDFYVEKTSAGQVTVDYYASASQLSILNGGGPSGTNANLGNGVLETFPYPAIFYPLEQVQDRLWHPVYFQSVGECIQIFIAMTPTQIVVKAIAFSDFELNALILYTNRGSDRLQ